MKETLLKKTYNFFKKYYLYIIAILFIILVCISFFVYYKYIYLLTDVEMNIINDEVKIDQETLQNVLDNIILREDNLDRVRTNKYFDPFN